MQPQIFGQIPFEVLSTPGSRGIRSFRLARKEDLYEAQDSPVIEPENEHDVAGDHDNELDELKRGEIFLPPQVFLDRRSAGRQEVVAVHHDVDKGVEGELEARESETAVRDVEVHGESDRNVMEHVEGGNLEPKTKSVLESEEPQSSRSSIN